MSEISSMELPISGMTCASCAGRVERALAKVAGVGQVSVNLASERAHVSLQQPVDPQVLVQAVEKAGYAARLPDAPAPSRASAERQLRRERWQVCVALALAVPLVRLACDLHGQMATFAEAAVADRPA